jgi:flagellar basal-body rod protein FlgG
MNKVLSVALIGMHQDMSRLERIAFNLANVSTPGFKRQVSAGIAPAVSGLAEPGALDAPQVLVDQTPGTLRITRQPLDLALGGDGYFEVMTPSGPAYTRQGDFRLDGHGRLVTRQGDPVMGRDGVIQLSDASAVVVDASGRISVAGGPSGGAPVAQLRVVGLEAPGQAFGAGLLRAESVRDLDPASVQVHQGALENSNVSTMHEMVQLIDTMRHFETLQKVAQGHDEMLGQAIRKLGDL